MATDPRIPTLVSDAVTLDRKTDFRRDYSLGYCTLPGGFYDCNTDNLALTSGTVIFAKLEPIRASFTANRIALQVGQTESGTETDQRVGIYSSDGTTMTRLGISGASTTLLETDDIRVAATLATEVEMHPGIDYWAAILSVATTPGTVCGWSPVGVGAATETPNATEMPTRAYTLAAQTALDATEAISGMTRALTVPYLFAYYVAA